MAADWQLLYGLGESIQYSDNLEHAQHSPGWAGTSSTSANLDLLAQNPTWSWDLGTNFGYLDYFGSGITTQQARTTIAANTGLSKSVRNTSYNLGAHFSLAPATSTQLSALGIIAYSNIQNMNYGVSAGLNHQIDRLDSLSMSLSANRSDFSASGPNFAPNSSLSVSGSWSRRLTRRLDGNLSWSASYDRRDGSNPTENLVYNISVGGHARLLHNLDFSLSLGPYINQPLNSTQTTTVGGSGNLALNYRPLHDLSLSLGVSTGLTPDITGILQQSKSVNASANYSINDYSTFLVSASYSDFTPSSGIGSSSIVFSVNPAFNFRLARNWNANLSYRWLNSDQGKQNIQSNSFFVTLSYNGFLLH